MSAREKFSGLKKKVKEAKREMEAIADSAFKEGCKELFDENPTLKSFGFIAYTPFFCDGDECVFGIHNYFVNGYDEYFFLTHCQN